MPALSCRSLESADNAGSAELLIQRPIKFELIANLEPAIALDRTASPSRHAFSGGVTR